MCTVVVRWAAGAPVWILALRDELTDRAFDDPACWWPEPPDAVGGLDRTAGGTWCASRVSTGVTALVLNRPTKRTADPGAPSRGVLPLVATAHEQSWADRVALEGMASFALVLATPDSLSCWDFDGQELHYSSYEAGTHMFTSGGAEDGKATRFLDTFRRSDPADWRRLIRRDAPQDDLTDLVVRRERDGSTYATVFGQLITSSPGRLVVDYSRTPWRTEGWTTLALG